MSREQQQKDCGSAPEQRAVTTPTLSEDWPAAQAVIVSSMSETFASMFAATVGEELPSSRRVNASKTLGHRGNGKSKRFAEIIVATATAGEISLTASIANGTHIYTHETFRINRPPGKRERMGEGICYGQCNDCVD
jgi:hypothetical protein